jgi:cell division protein FtsW (lipid II flippase)
VLSLLLALVCFIFMVMVSVLGLYGALVLMRLVMPKAAYMMSLFKEFRIVSWQQPSSDLKGRPFQTFCSWLRTSWGGQRVSGGRM